ncbi:hypothetical protein [Acinetobacter shaoyimingii]|uniref:Uncharacterized protein n=1 Tax=Acinetobacter shaoyimingii TaxID=2715164 RepID=A0A6G8RX45_9GAMM|nr:hypothetical protein [Acinetobacter shaoyimingii]NHB57919.1 hypothetical protein [Acinetobacter shaoyimingii]QIO06516.1 hypothetical protein G8E00_11415 [Acinetobacter shaoyimingii]
MNTPWLKSLIFWSVVIAIVYVVFQCTQRTESSRAAPTLMYERLYYCAKELNTQQHQALIHKIKSHVQPNIKQNELMQLLNECRQANPMKSTESYMQLIKNIEHQIVTSTTAKDIDHSQNTIEDETYPEVNDPSLDSNESEIEDE